MNNNSIELTTRIYNELKRVLGVHFANIRNERGISLRDLSAQTGISKALIGAFEVGERLPRMDNIINLMLALEMPFEDVFGAKVQEAKLNYTAKPTQKRDDEQLSNLLLKMNLDNEKAKKEKLKKKIDDLENKKKDIQSEYQEKLSFL